MPQNTHHFGQVVARVMGVERHANRWGASVLSINASSQNSATLLANHSIYETKH
jgi:hypothetical protein